MASLLERIQNVFDNHQDLQRERIRQEGHQQALYQTRDALLGSAVLLKDDWSQELTRTRSESHAGIHARYEARIQGLNDAFSVLRQSQPGITTQLIPMNSVSPPHAGPKPVSTEYRSCSVRRINMRTLQLASSWTWISRIVRTIEQSSSLSTTLL